MKTRKLLFFICMCCLIAAPAVWGQATTIPAKSGILGYLDRQTGTFRPVSQAVAEDVELPAATTVTGTITVTITVTLKTTSLTNVICSAEVLVSDGASVGSPREIAESNTVAGTGTSTTRTCKLSIPYSWSLLTQSSDSMLTSYSVSGTTGTSGLPQRTSSLTPVDTRKVPSSGTTTALTAAVTI